MLCICTVNINIYKRHIIIWTIFIIKHTAKKRVTAVLISTLEAVLLQGILYLFPADGFDLVVMAVGNQNTLEPYSQLKLDIKRRSFCESQQLVSFILQGSGII